MTGTKRNIAVILTFRKSHKNSSTVGPVLSGQVGGPYNFSLPFFTISFLNPGVIRNKV